MVKQKTITRTSFLRIISAFIAGLVGWIWYQLSSFQTEREKNLEFRHGRDIPMGISYFDAYYLFRDEHVVRAFLTRCTHAGCRIGVHSGTELQCNCHGSRFEAQTGSPLKGPAIKPLQEIKCRLDKENGQWVVSLSPVVSKSSSS